VFAKQKKTKESSNYYSDMAWSCGDWHTNITIATVCSGRGARAIQNIVSICVLSIDSVVESAEQGHRKRIGGDTGKSLQWAMQHIELRRRVKDRVAA
jgi:hypothetical protein